MHPDIHLPVAEAGPCSSRRGSEPGGFLPGTRDQGPKEKCGVFGLWGHPNSVHLSYLGLYAQQHRGQESAGIAVSDGTTLTATVGMGLVADVFDDDTLRRLQQVCTPTTPTPTGPAGAIGHNRYSTTGGSKACNAQPLLQSFVGGQVAVAHNGNLINAEAHRKDFEQAGHIFHTTSDTEVIVHLLASPAQQSQADPLAATLRRLQGAFSLVFLFPDRIEAARDPWGWRPLVLGKIEEDGKTYHVVVSETVALHVIGATFVREVEPGEIVTIDSKGVRSRRFTDHSAQPAHCAFEHVYFASPASNVFGQNVQRVRETLGERLAREAPVEADFVMPMPDSGRSAANGYARASGLPYREGIVPNRYVGRTFIKPTPEARRAAVRLKLNVVEEIVRGQRVIVVDDSVVRGTTTQVKMAQIRDAGAKEIHLRISCPPIRHPCYFGVDFASRDQLIAAHRTVEEIRDFLGVDSLHFLSLDGMLACMDHKPGNYCSACWTGEYRLDPDNPETGPISEAGQLKIFPEK